MVTEQYTHAESLMKNAQISTLGNSYLNEVDSSGIEASLSANVIGVRPHQLALQGCRDQLQGRNFEVGRSVEDVTGVFSIEKYIKLSKNESTTSNIDWLPCL